MVTISIGETLRIQAQAALADGFVADSCVAYIRGPASYDAPGTTAWIQNGYDIQDMNRRDYWNPPVIGGIVWMACIAQDTTGYTAGTYAVEVWGASATGEKRVLFRETIEFKASAQSIAPGYDPRTFAEKSLDAIRKMLAGTAEKGVKSYTINNRTLERYSMGELLQLESHFAMLVNREKYRKNGGGGLGPRIAVFL